MFVRRLLSFVVLLLCSTTVFAQVAGQNINMVSGTNWPAGDPFLQRQNEPSLAVSSRNPEHLLGGANDYRTVDIPNPNAPNILGDAWVGVYTSMDGGETFKSTLLPGFPQDTSTIGKASPLHSFTVATDPTVRAGSHGLFYYSGLVFNRGTNSPSGVFVATFQDLNNKGNGDAAYLQTNNGKMHGNPFSYIGVNLVDTGTSGQFLDKPWIAVDIPRPGRAATCKINNQTFSSGYVYVVYTQFNGSQSNPASKIKAVVSTNCGASWSQPQVLSQAQKLAQGTVAAIDPATGTLYIAWRQIGIPGNQNQPDAIQFAYSTNGGGTFSTTAPVYTFAAPTSSNPYPPGATFDQPQANSTTFRSLDVPALAVDNNGRVWLAFSQRFNGPTPGTYTSRIMVMTLPKGSTKNWTAPYVADGSAASSTTTRTYGHQFMPSLNFAYGKLMLAWLDSRRDNLQSVLQCPSGATCTDLSQVNLVDAPIPGSTIANPTTVFTPYISDPNSGVRHTIDVYGAVINPANGPTSFTPFQVSQYPFYVDDANNQIEQGFFNPPNLPMFVQGTTPFIGDYIDIAAQSIMPSGANSWAFNTQATDATGATNAPDFHVTWTDNRDVVAPPVVNGSQDWTQYVPPNGGNSQVSTYSGVGLACPTCSTTQPACNLINITNADGTIGESSYSGDRNQNVYTSRISNGLVVRFRENTKLQPANTQAPPQRAYSLLVKNTVSPLNTTPVLGAPSYYRILLGETTTSQGTTGVCNTVAVPASFPTTANCYLDITVNPKSAATQAITVSTSTNPSINVLVAQIACIPGSNGCGNTPVFKGLQALAVVNADATNPSVADPDFLNTDNDNPDVEAPYQNLPIAAGEEYYPTVDSPQDPDNNIFTPKISVPAIFTPKIGTVANSAPVIETPTIFTPKITSIFTPKITSVQVANPTIVNTIFTPKIFTPKIFTPKIVSPDIFTPKINNLSDNSLTDYSWKVTNKGNTSASYSTSELAKSTGVQCCPANCSANPGSCTVTANNPAGPNCSVCQLVQHKVYESPTANRDSTNLNPTCDLTVQQNYVTVANIVDPAFSTSGGVGSAADPTNSTLSLSPGEGNRVTLRVVAPPVTQTVSPFKTQATPFASNTGQNTPAGSLTITTSVLPVAVVGQSYASTVLRSVGGFGTTYWTVPPDPANPVAVLPPPAPASSEPLPVTPLALRPSGQISTSVITASPGTYTVSFQIQDSAVTGTVNPVSTPAVDVQQVNVLVNKFSILSVDVQIGNELGSTGYMKAGDVAKVYVTVSSVGPANATNVAAGIQVNPTPGGTQQDATLPIVTCTPAIPASASIMGTGAQLFIFTCTAMNAGNGYVTFTASANGHYVNVAADVLATATTVTVPPTNLLSTVIVDTVAPSLKFAATITPQSGQNPQSGQIWYNQPVVIPYSTSDNLSGVASAVATSPNATNTGIDRNGNGAMTLTTEGTLVMGTITVTDFANNSAPFTSFGFNIDKTPPTISGVTDRPANNFNWYNAPAKVTFTCDDPKPLNVPVQQHSGVASCTSPVTLSTEGANQSASGTAFDVAGNSANTTVSGINIDLTPPSAGIASPTSNAVYVNNQPIAASYTCADGLSGVASCIGLEPPAGPVPSGTAFTQTVPGSYTFSVTAVDKASNQSVAAVNYSTAYYGFTGFQSPLAAAAGPTPVSTPPATPTNSGSFVQGTTIPILWTLLSPATNLPVIDPATLTALSAYPYNNSTCTGGIPSANAPIHLLPASELNSYVYDAVNQRFQFLWNTTSTTPSCYYLLITFNDLSAYATNVIVSAAATSNGLSLAGTSTVDGTNSALPQTGNPISMEAWVNLANPSSMNVFTYGQGYGLAVMNQHVHLIAPTQDVEGSIAIPVGQWTHITVSYDGSGPATLYVNGALDKATSLPGTGSAASNFIWRIGDLAGAAVPSQAFVGMIDEVKVWSATRTASQIVSDITNELCIGQTSLVAYYKFNQGTTGSQIPSGTILADVSSSQANGTINNSNSATPASWAQGAPALGDSLSIAVAPANAALSLSGPTSQQFTASGSCTDGSTLSLSSLNWSVNPAGVVTIDNTGLVTAQVQGNATVSAASADATGSATVTVGP